MRNKYFLWLITGTLVIASLLMSMGPFPPASAAGGPNLTLGKSITASSHTQIYSEGNVQDSNQATYWESTNNTFPQWLQVDLGAVTSIDQIVLKLPAGWEARTQTLSVHGSTDGTVFTTILGSADYSFSPSVQNNTVTISFNSADTRYVRLSYTANTVWPAAQLAEFEIYGTSGTTPTATPTTVPTATPTATATPAATATATIAPTATATPVPGSNIAIGKSITASSSTQSFAAAHANDNSTSTYWEGNGHPNTLTLDLGANYNITSIVLKLNPAAEWSTRTQTIQVLGHNQSSSTFSNLVTAQSYTFNPSTGNSVTLPVTATVKRLQLNITSNSGAPSGQIAEFQVFGSPAPNPDLTVTGMAWSPASPVENSAITLNAVVKNSGNAASGSTTVNFYLDGELAGSAPVGELAAGQFVTVSLNAGTQKAASYALSAKVDESNTVIEQNESNNSYTNPSNLVVAPVASSDLIGITSWTPVTPVAGNTLGFTVNLKNQGSIASASGAHGITVVLKNSAGSTIQTYSGSYSGVIAAGASANVSIPGTWTAGAGNYTVTTTVAADANELQAKQDNNVNTSNLVVYAQRGASVPYSRYDTDDAVRGGAAALKTAPNFDQAQIASKLPASVISHCLRTAPMLSGRLDKAKAGRE